MAGLKITAAPSRSDRSRHLAATEAALSAGRAHIATLAATLDLWQYALDRIAFLESKAGPSPSGDAQRFYKLEIDGLLAEISEQVQWLCWEDAPLERDAETTVLGSGEPPSFALPMLAKLALTVADFGLAEKTNAKTSSQESRQSLASPPSLEPAKQPLRAVTSEDRPVAAPLTALEAARAHLKAQRNLLAEAEAKIDAITSGAQVFAENLSAARSHLSARRYGEELTKVTAAQMHGHAASAAAAIGGLHGVDDRIFWGE